MAKMNLAKKASKRKLPAKPPAKRVKKSKTGAMGKKLETLDPELYEYLQENDKSLLEFEDSDLDIGEAESEKSVDSDVEEENATDSSEPEEEDGDNDEKVDADSKSQDVASDESDMEEDEEPQSRGKVTTALVNKWENDLQLNKRSIKPVNTVVKAFHACLVRISSDEDAGQINEFKVDGSSVFNAVIRLCVTSLYPYLRKLLNLPPTSVSKKTVENSKKWSYAKNTVRTYIVDLVKLIKNVSSEDILRVLLKHFHQMIPFVSALPTISKPVTKQLISLWSTNSDDTVRVISFLCILRLAVSDQNVYLQPILKKMYMQYVSNSKFVSYNTIPSVNFMRKSLTEMFSLNESVSYNHAFLYIRQLAIHLRNGVTTKKKDSIQAVYNWQFISSLQLWVDVLCNTQNKDQLKSLIYPTIQVIVGCIKLIPTAQYFPLRFHCIKMLIKFTKETGTFIPVLPFIVEVLSILSANAQHKKVSMRPMDFSYILRLSKAQMQENAFKDAVMEHVYECILEYTAAESHRISFPDTVLLLQIHAKQFLKECKNANYSRKLKPLLDKIDEVSKAVNVERSKCGIALSDEKGIAAWESNLKLKSNALVSFYASWRKMNDQKMARKNADQIQIKEPELPVLTKLPSSSKKNKKKSAASTAEPESDESYDEGDSEPENADEDESESEMKRKTKTQKNVKNKKKQKKLQNTKKKPENKLAESTGKSISEKPRIEKTADLNEDEFKDVVKDFDLKSFLS